MLGEEGVGSTVCQCGRPGMKPSEYQQRLRISRARELLELSRDSTDWYDAESILESHTHRDPPLNCVAEPGVSDSIADWISTLLTSALGHKQTKRPAWTLSALPPKADI